MYKPVLTPIAGSLTASALVALLPLVTLFVLLAIRHVKAHWAALAAMAVAVVVAIAAFGMPTRLALLAASEGAVFGLLPIMWIVFAAIWVYQLTVVSGRFEDLRAVFGIISDDVRVQSIIIAFCFGALLEALAGFGAPVAISSVMLIALGFSPVRAAVTALVANTAPVAFGAIATPVITAGTLTKISYEEIGAVVGRQTSVLAIVVPFLLLTIVDGRRGLRQVWPVALVAGGTFATAQFVSSSYVSVELADIIAALVALGATVAFLRVYRPVGGAEARRDLLADGDATGTGGARRGGRSVPGSGRVIPGAGGGSVATVDAEAEARSGAQPAISGARIPMALAPYLIIVVLFSVAKLWEPAKEFLTGTDVKIAWPGLDGQVMTIAGKVSTATVYTLPWLSSPGTMLLFAGILVAVLYRVGPVAALREFGTLAVKLRYALLTVSSLLSLAYVMNLSAQTIIIGAWIAGTGAAFAFLSPILGWLGTALTGSDTSATALFATMQQAAATKAGIDPTLLVSANTTGGAVGKMISPQNLIIAAAAVGIPGREDVLFRKTVRWSLALLLGLCTLVFLQSNALSWMLP